MEGLRCLWLIPICLLTLLVAPTSSRSPAAAEEASVENSYPAPKAVSSLLLGIDSIGDQVIVVGDRGHILTSSDAGQTWSQCEVPTRRMLCAVDIVDEQNAWVVGHDAIILYSGDGGRTWSRQYYAPEEEAPLFDVWFEDRQHGIAIGAYGLCLETFDGGGTWSSRIISEEDPHFFDITESPAGMLYVAGEFGTILRSADRGKTWQGCPSPYNGSFFGVLALQDETVLVFGLRGNLYRSTDKGDNWLKLETGTSAALLGGTQRADGSIVLVGLSGCVLASQDASSSFRLFNRPDRTAMAIAYELNPELLLILGEDGITRWEDLSLE